jgi:alpha-N-arabinofuranosidase
MRQQVKTMKQLKAVINTLDQRSHINRELYGHFSEHLGRCIYEGIFVGRDSTIPNTDGVRLDVIQAFKDIQMPVLRWPGGCFADEYHWRDGIGAAETRKKMVNTHWGGVTEDNSFGTHEFFNLCEEIGCEPYLAGNMGSGSVEELADWIEYITFDGISPMAELRRQNGREKPWKLKYLGIGNENWGCGGNMRPEYYADTYRRYQTYCRNFGGNELYKIACGPNADDYDWTDKLLEVVKDWHARAISLHYYTVPTGDWSHKGNATEFSDEEYYATIQKTLYMEQLIDKHQAIMKKHSDRMKLVVDEWGCWYDVEPGTNPGFLYQQNTMRDAIVAACNLNIFNQHSDIVCMANLAQAVNVLQALLLTEGEKLVKTPTYHVFDLFKAHQDSELVYSFVEEEHVEGIPAISQSASVDAEGHLTITLANCSLEEDYELDIQIIGTGVEAVAARILTGDVHDCNTFEDAGRVTITDHPVERTEQGIRVTLPKCSVVEIRA